MVYKTHPSPCGCGGPHFRGWSGLKLTWCVAVLWALQMQRDSTPHPWQHPGKGAEGRVVGFVSWGCPGTSSWQGARAKRIGKQGTPWQGAGWDGESRRGWKLTVVSSVHAEASRVPTSLGWTQSYMLLPTCCFLEAGLQVVLLGGGRSWDRVINSNFRVHGLGECIFACYRNCVSRRRLERLYMSFSEFGYTGV